mgnify:CR=1 FL=1
MLLIGAESFLLCDVLIVCQKPTFRKSIFASFDMEEDSIPFEELPTKFAFDPTNYELVAQGAEGVI